MASETHDWCARCGASNAYINGGRYAYCERVLQRHVWTWNPQSADPDWSYA
jgi:NADH pyrophosphatase NudC (nudix superfamily)